MSYLITKTFGTDRGLSCCYRQWRDTSHCNLLHGYSIGVKITIGCDSLDDRNWVYSFGEFKELKSWLEVMFDHTTLVAEDDPKLRWFQYLDEQKLISIRVVQHVGCEMFASMIFLKMEKLIHLSLLNKSNRNVWVQSVEVFEHAGNSAIYTK
jgi:6-pyruvoyltetrahydropterin/6-carboxytetrahydropterin synthase